MMSLSQIEAISRAAARRSRALGLRPVDISASTLREAGSLEGLHAAGISIPHIGTRNPKGYREVGEPFFIDLSGWGREGEPALTMGQTFQAMLALTEAMGTLSWALGEVGQFQGYLRAFKTK